MVMSVSYIYTTCYQNFSIWGNYIKTFSSTLQIVNAQWGRDLAASIFWEPTAEISKLMQNKLTKESTPNPKITGLASNVCTMHHQEPEQIKQMQARTHDRCKHTHSYRTSPRHSFTPVYTFFHTHTPARGKPGFCIPWQLQEANSFPCGLHPPIQHLTALYSN